MSRIMRPVWIGVCRAPLGLKAIVVGVSPARWAGLRNGRAVGARPRQLAAARRMVNREHLPSSTQGAGMGLSGFVIRHPGFVLAGECNGRVRVNVAPWFAPSLWTERAPPNSLAARAPLCKPKPWPLRRVVKPCAKMRVRFSGGMPTPLSFTSTHTWFEPDAPTRMVISLSARLPWLRAYLALL